MRPALAIGVALALLVPGLLISPGLTVAASPHSEGPAFRAAPSADPGIPRNLRFGWVNATLPVHPGVSVPPVSVYTESPAPNLPNTTPINVPLPQGVVNCCVWSNFSAPTGGPWAAIEFTYVGAIVGEVYDSSYRAYIDGAQFLEGTSPEYGTWTVHSDLTPYAALFHGTVNLSLYVGAATIDGHFIANCSLDFYPLPTGASAPAAPSEIVPIFEWNHTYLDSASGRIFANVTVPDNVTNATLQLYLYGFGATDEFWYSAQPAYRQALVTVDGRLLAAAYPFPYLNTGGIDLFLWRPVTSDFTIEDRPLDVDVSGSIGLLEGTHEFEANVSGMLNGNTWLVGASLLLYTSTAAGPATQTQYSASTPPVVHTSGTGTDDSSDSLALTTSSTFDESSTPRNLTTVLSESFSNQQTFTQGVTTSTQNVSQLETLETVTYANSTNTSSVTVHDLRFPFAIDLNNVMVKVSSSGSSTTYNFSVSIPLFRQEWDESEATGTGTADSVTGPTARVDDLTAAQGTYSGQEVAQSGGGAMITALYGSVSSLSKTYTASVLDGDPSWTYAHTLSTAGNDPPGPFNAATLLADSVDAPISAAAAWSRSTIDLGQVTTLTAWGVGGTGQYTYGWIDLPAACRGTDSATVTCQPGAAGTYDTSVEVSDSGTNSTTVSAAPLVVEPALSVAIVPSRTAWDAGRNLSLAAVVTGGSGVGAACQWSINGSTVGPAESCDVAQWIGGLAGSPTTAQVSVVDSTGALSSSPVASFTPSEAPIVSIALTSPTGSPLASAGAVAFNLSILGGSAPFSVQWSVNGGNVSGATGTTFVWTPATPENGSVAAWVTDAANVTVGSAPLTERGGVVPSRPSSTPAGNSTSVDETGWYVAALVGVAAAVLLILLYVLLRPPSRTAPPPRRTTAPRPRPPAPPPGD